MQHITHVFVGSELESFRDKFASTYRRLHPDFEESLFTALSLTKDDDGRHIFSPDEKGDSEDATTIDGDNRLGKLNNYFEDLYGRKVTVAHPGNRSMIVMLWVKLYEDDDIWIIKELTQAIKNCNSNISVEVNGFTHDSVSCFIAKPGERKSPDIYRTIFESNISQLRQIRPNLSALRLIANRNMDNVALDLDEEAMARICAEFSAVVCKHYLSIRIPVFDSQEQPFETFGISSILFDLEYYKEYIRNRLLIDKMIEQGIEDRKYNVNALAQSTNPIVRDVLNEIAAFNEKTIHARATLALKNDASATNVVGQIDGEVKDIVKRLEAKIDKLCASDVISIFEREALLSLILGEDSAMFDTSAVDAEELTIDDVLDESARYFIFLDEDSEKLKNVSQKDIKEVRKCMRNIAEANRRRTERIKALNIQIKESEKAEKHLGNNGYRFGEVDYKVDLNIDTEPLEQVYEPHDISVESVDMSDNFAPVRNQGKQGSCASFAISSVIEALRGDSNRYSPAYLYWNARESNNMTQEDSGASLNDIVRIAMRKGVCTEEKMPYNAEVYNVAPSEAAENEAVDCRILEAKTVEPKLKDIKSALSDGYPVVIAARIFDSFSDTHSGFVRHPSSEELAGGDREDGHGKHAMVICGFSDKERVFIVRNSWGKDFGENGYCYIPYSYAQQYFLQACIVTKVSESDAKRAIEKQKTLNFNMADSNIEAAILQNLISEDEFELQELEEKSTQLRTDWAQNVAVLGNVNNQTEILRIAQEKIDERINKEEVKLSALQSSENPKIKDFKRGYMWGLIFSGLSFVMAWVLVYLIPSSTVTWIIAAIMSLIFFILLGRYEYSWRRYRQDLRDEIQRQAETISALRQEKMKREINAHIYGTVLREAEHYKLKLYSEYQTLKNFNSSWLDLYKRVNERQQKMTPMVPYPFLAILTNDGLDRYYMAWRHKMIEPLDMKMMYSEFAANQNITHIIEHNRVLNDSVVRGLRHFSMKEYLMGGNPGHWQFIEGTNMNIIIPDLDSRAKPFSPYRNNGESPIEKYIIIKGVAQEEMGRINNCFSYPPCKIDDSDPYSISVLNIVRYDL